MELFMRERSLFSVKQRVFGTDFFSVAIYIDYAVIYIPL